MGVPVVTLRGDSHASNVGASLLSAAGLGEMITASEEEYIDCAAALARDLSRLGEIRASLRERMASSPLCDAAGFAQRFEALMRRAWAAWCGGATPTIQ